MPDAVLLVSGGMDSVTLAYDMARQGYETIMVSFDYGQRHRKELDCAHLCVARLGAAHAVVDLSSMGQWLKGSALTDGLAVPDGHYTNESMKVTIVPNRNAIMLSVAAGVAVGAECSMIAFAAHAGDHPIYPDCRSEFVQAFEQMIRIAVDDPQFVVHAPYLNKTKSDIVKVGAVLGVPYEDTWSCYKGGEVHCGTCGTCVERREAFALAGVPDPTQYSKAQSQQPA